MIRRLCKKCGEVKPVSEFYKRRMICKRCVLNRVGLIYKARHIFREEFVCKVCGRRRTADQESSYARNVCKVCHAAALLAKKSKAPATLRCHVCGERKPKSEFERYSMTRCKECAAEAVKRIKQRRKEDESRTD